MISEGQERAERRLAALGDPAALNRRAEKRERRLDVTIKLSGIILPVSALLIGIWQYQQTAHFDAQRAIEARAAEAKLQLSSAYWAKRLDIYGRISQASGALAVDCGKSPEFEKAKSALLNLYWGEAVLTEDPALEAALVELREYLDIFEPTDPNSVSTLTRHCLLVSKACRQAIDKARQQGFIPQ